DRAFLVDTRSLSSGIALAALKASDYREKGLSAREIKEKIENEIVPRISASFFVPQLDYLYKGGRCSRLSAYFGTKLKLSPQLVLIDGKIVPGEKFRGGWSKVCADYLEVTLKDGSGIDKSRVFITHTTLGKEKKRAEIAEMLKKQFGFKEVIDNFAGATIASHCGPGTLGVLFIKE
ncbi:MAG: DegV family protein, partial [Eubacteriales bacterium]